MGKALGELLICLSNLSESAYISICFHVRNYNTDGIQNTKKKSRFYGMITEFINVDRWFLKMGENLDV